MTTEDRTRAIAWFEKQARMFGLAAEALNAGRWIPVSERLPEDCQNIEFCDDGQLRFTTVLTVSNGCVKETNRLIVRKTGNAYLDQYATDGWEWSGNTDVTHWMPLPDPPRKDGEA